MAFYGGWSGPSCKFRVVLDFRVTDQTDTQAYVQYRFYVTTTGGSFKGSTLKTSWGPTVSLYNNGTYADSGWINHGWVNYGSGVWKSGNAYYTGGSGTTYSSTASGTYYPSAPTWEPYAPSELSVERVNDNKNTLSWTNSIATARPYASIRIERITDGGSWSEIESVSAATSYSDTTTTTDHSYQYRIRAHNKSGSTDQYSDYATCDTVLYNTPAAPTGITTSRLAETTVKLDIENVSNTATALEIQRSADSAAWETVATVEGSPVTETTDEPGGGTFYYRARNTRDDLVSDWSPASNAVVTICAPAAPTLKSPASGSVVRKATEQVTFVWAHNPIDGSAQAAAKLRYSLDKGATWTEVAIEGNAASYELENAFAVNSEVTWSVCTKGAHEDYGPWSDNRVFYVYQTPSVAFAQPTDGFTVENMPILIELQYDDVSGALANASFSIAKGNKTVYTRNMGAETTCEIQATEWLPEDGEAYTVTATVRSSSSLVTTAMREFSVSFTPPKPGVLHIENEGETGYVRLVTSIMEDEELEPPTSVSVYRVVNGSQVLLGEGLRGGSALIDKYAPLNEGYQYIVTTHAESGAINSQVYPNEVRSIKWFLCFGDNEVASAIYNPESDIKLSRPSKRQVHYAGRKWPVSYDGYNVSDERSLSAALFTYEDMEAFRALMYSGGRCVFKSYDGDVFHADVDVSLKPDFTTPNLYGTVTLNIVRIDGGDL